ncbi:MAG: hypothetical protein ACE5JA_00015 [bacterium]
MGKRKRKKVIDRLARKRGRMTAKSRLKHKKPPKASKKARRLTDEQRQAAEAGLARSPLLLSAAEFAEIHFDAEKLEKYLQDVKASNLEDSAEFLSDGLGRLADEDFLFDIKLRLLRFIRTQEEDDPASAFSASLVLSLAEEGKDLTVVPFFAALFVREIKNHPMAEDPIIWRLLSPYLPSRIVKPEQELEPVSEDTKTKRSKKYPHLVLPESYADEGSG